MTLIGIRTNTQGSGTIDGRVIRIANIIDFMIFIDVQHGSDIRRIRLEKDTICETGCSSSSTCILHFMIIAAEHNLRVRVAFWITFIQSLSIIVSTNIYFSLICGSESREGQFLEAREGRRCGQTRSQLIVINEREEGFGVLLTHTFDD